SSFPYLIPPRGSQKFVTAGGAPGATTGSVRIIPVAGQTAPVSQVIFVYKPREVTVSLAGVSTLGATSFRTYVESSGIAGRPGNVQSALAIDRKSTRLNSSHQIISYAVFCLKKKN